MSALLRPALDSLYASYDHAESAIDPIQIVRRYKRVDDREIVAFVAAGLAFGRVASVMASVEAVCKVLGPRPAAFVRRFDPERDGGALLGLGHRWIRGRDLVALIWVLRHLLERHGSIEASVSFHLTAVRGELAPALDRWTADIRAIDLRPAYGKTVPRSPGVWYFFARPSTGSACKRLNLFLRWMVRQDGVDPGGWTSIPKSALVVPLDTHTMRLGRCLRLTRRVSPGWKMAAEITDALREFDPDDPVRYDFALCHLGMMGGCGWGTRRGNAQCPLKSACHPVPNAPGRLTAGRPGKGRSKDRD
jgi:uncharacterized protein (TIGR02757 family)